MAEPDSSDTSPTTAKRLTEAEWAEAKALYETGRMTKVDLGKKFGVSRQAIAEGLNKRGAVYGARSKEVEEATAEGQRTDAAKRSEEVAQMREERKKSVQLLAKLQNKIIGEALQANKPISSAQPEIKALNGLLKNSVLIRSELWEIYDLNRDPDAGDEIPEFIVSEYEPDEIRAINSARLGIDPDAELEKLAAGSDIDGELDDLLGDDDGG